VKRSEEDVTTENESDETDQDHEPDGDDTTEGGDNADAGDAGAPSSAAAGAPTAGGTAASSRPVPTASTQATTEAVVAALEAMSGVVEMLATQATTEKAAPKKPPRPPQADENDDDESDELDNEEDDADEDEEPAPPPRRRGRGKPAPTRRAKADEPIAQVKAALGRLEALIRGGTRAPAASAPPTSTTPDLAAQLDGVHKAITELKTLVTGQAERLRTVEKNVGLPASRPVEGQRGKAKGDEEVSWPLDMNQPVDREHVDKSVSFHF